MSSLFKHAPHRGILVLGVVGAFSVAEGRPLRHPRPQPLNAPGTINPWRPVHALADSDPVLTVETLTHMTAFWTRFRQEPDSITTAGRKANQTSLPLSIAGQQLTLPQVVNIVAMAAKYPAIATDLQRAGLTAEQWEAYRIALFDAWIAQHSRAAVQVPATSLLGKNLAFLNAHPKEFGALQATGMWFPTARLSLSERELPAALAALRLQVQPHAMATGTRTATAGLQAIDAQGDSLLNGAYIYVPPQCVGKRRVPLVVFLHGASMTGESMITWRNVRALADSMGVIIVAPSSSAYGETWQLENPDGRKIEAALRYVLQHDAIDPQKIVMAGASDGGRWALWVGLMNGDIFSRILAFSPSEGLIKDSFIPGLLRTGTPPIFLQHGRPNADFDTHEIAQWLREKGYTVTYATDSGSHPMTQERASAGFRWLANSWR